MKRIITLLLAAGLVLGASAGSAKATDVKVSGTWQFAFQWMDSSFEKDDTSDTFKALQRLRTKVDIITSENLRGVAFFEIGKSNWGKDDAALGTDGKSVKVRYSYVDWVVPQTDLKIRMGLQPWINPNFTKGAVVLDGDGAGITASYQVNDMFGVTLGWLRAENDNNNFRHNALDLIMLTLPVQGDGFKVTPWAMYGILGQNSLNDGGKNNGDMSDLRYGMAPIVNSQAANDLLGEGVASKKHGNAWWLGLGGELTMFSPFRLAADFTYGSMDMGGIDFINPAGMKKTWDIQRAGWYASLLAEYKMDMATPGLFFWYASGDDSNPLNGSERMPSIDASFDGTYYGFSDADFNGDSVLGNNPAGTWGLALIVKDITFMEDLSHAFEVAYVRGTNNKNMPANAGMSMPFGNYTDTNGVEGYTYLTTKDWAWEVDFNTKYQLYKNMYMMLELAYIRLDLDEGVWGKGVIDATDKNAYKVGVTMRYDF